MLQILATEVSIDKIKCWLLVLINAIIFSTLIDVYVKCGYHCDKQIATLLFLQEFQQHLCLAFAFNMFLKTFLYHLANKSRSVLKDVLFLWLFWLYSCLLNSVYISQCLFESCARFVSGCFHIHHQLLLIIFTLFINFLLNIVAFLRLSWLLLFDVVSLRHLLFSVVPAGQSPGAANVY